jgi:hypothetical protein
MKLEAWIFAGCSIFLLIVTPVYWFSTSTSFWTGNNGDWTGTSALVMTFLLTTLVAFYLGFHARKISESGGRPEDRQDGEIAEGAGELGFFPPYSWWPLWCGLCLAAMAAGVAVGWWMFIIGGVLGAVALCGLIFEYYRGEHAH